MSRTVTLLLALAVLALTPTGVADHATIPDPCDSDGTPSAGMVELVTPSGTYYVDDRNFALGNGIWIYEESNGIWVDKPAGVYTGAIVEQDLQRGGTSILLGDQDYCKDGHWEPDTLLY